MVKGLQRFQGHFREYRDQFVLLAETKTRNFGRAFWAFIEEG